MRKFAFLVLLFVTGSAIAGNDDLSTSFKNCFHNPVGIQGNHHGTMNAPFQFACNDTDSKLMFLSLDGRAKDLRFENGDGSAGIIRTYGEGSVNQIRCVHLIRDYRGKDVSNIQCTISFDVLSSVMATMKL